MPTLCVLMIVVLIIVVVAYALFRNTKTPTPEFHVSPEETREAEPVIETPVPSPEDAPSPKVVMSPKVVSSPKVVPSPKAKKRPKPDDLTRLDGIGPKANQVLKKAGITTFAQLANAEMPRLREALDAAGYRFMDPAGWIEQAKLAAEGKFEDLKELQSRLKGSRKVG